MKNLKKVLALVVVFSMMLCSVAFAAFPDVPEDADYANAVDTLVALGIINGDGQGNFNPDNTITRCEFTKIVCELLGLKGDSKGATAFADVAADHWASGYINLANGLKINNAPIIAGMGDGTFAPEAPVTYEQAIKMLVVALGYEPMAAQNGGWPNGYMATAQSIGMTKGIKAPVQTEAAKRSLIAELAYNALDCALMEQDGYGSEVSYKPMNGENNTARKTLLTTKFDVVKLGGVILANDKTSLGATAAEGEVRIAYDNNFKSTNEDFAWERGDGLVLFDEGIEVGETNAADYVGMRVIAFIQDTGREFVMVAIVPESGKNATVEIAASDIEAADCKTEGDELILAYWEDEDAKDPEELEISEDCVVVWNGQTGSAYDLEKIVDEAEDISAKITLVDWDNDEAFDMIKVEQYTHYIVEEVDGYEIVTTTNDDIDLEPDEELEIVVKDVKGNEVAIEAIAEGDVLAVISDNINDAANFESFINITVLPKSYVEGSVKTYDENENTVSIDGTVYAIDAEIDSDDEAKVTKLGSEGIFYLGIDGQIIAFDGAKVAGGNFGIILQTAFVGGDFGDEYQIKLLTSDGQAVIYDFADTINVQGESGIDTDDADEKLELAGVATWGDLMEKYEKDNELAVTEKFVQYKVNSEGKISALTFAGDETFTVGENREDLEYKASKNRLKDIDLNETNTIFVLAKDLENSKVITADSLIDENEYDAIAIKADKEVVCVAITGGASQLAGVIDGWAVATKVSATKDANDDDATLVEFVENGSDEVKSILITTETVVDTTYNTEENVEKLTKDIAAGSLFFYAADAEGNATAFALIANVAADGETYELKVDGALDEETKFICGTIDADQKLIDSIYVGGKLVDIEKETYEYTFANGGKKATVEVGSYKAGDVEKAKDGESHYVVVRVVEDEVKDIITIEKRTAIEE